MANETRSSDLGRRGERCRGVARLAAALRRPICAAEFTALLLPIVRRALRTRRGPGRVLDLVRARVTTWPVGDGVESVARTLADELARCFLDLPDPRAETLVTARGPRTARPGEQMY